MKVSMYDEPAGYFGLHDTSHSLLGGGATAGYGDASTLQVATDYPCHTEMGTVSSLGHHNPHRHTGLLPKQQLDGEVVPDSSIYYHHHGHQHYYDLSALPTLLGANSQELPPGEVDDTPSPASTVLYDPPSVQMEFCSHNPQMGNVLQWLPREQYGFVPLSAGFAGSVCDGGDEGYVGEPVDGVLGFGGEMGMLRRGGVKGSNDKEKQRRGKMCEKFNVLRSLLPNPRKHDRASIIAEATDYVQELLRRIDELRILVEAKRQRSDRGRKTSTAVQAEVDQKPSVQHSGGDLGRPSNGLLRTSWLQRTLKDTSVDVRIVEDEVNIKLVRRRKAGCCLLLVARAILDLQLELLHLAAGDMGDSHVFMINCKIDEGSSVYASAIAKKLVEAVLDGAVPGVSF
uniref:Transcription factor bHLH89 n=1 Tax=Anthurium amnicola TaxID=1678845 RepID=A0A1D1Y3U5_9ARAE